MSRTPCGWNYVTLKCLPFNWEREKGTWEVIILGESPLFFVYLIRYQVDMTIPGFETIYSSMLLKEVFFFLVAVQLCNFITFMQLYTFECLCSSTFQTFVLISILFSLCMIFFQTGKSLPIIFSTHPSIASSILPSPESLAYFSSTVIFKTAYGFILPFIVLKCLTCGSLPSADSIWGWSTSPILPVHIVLPSRVPGT